MPNSGDAQPVFQKPQTARLKRTESTPSLLPAYLMPVGPSHNPYTDTKPVIPKPRVAFRKTIDSKLESILSKKIHSSGRPQPPPSSTLASPPSKQHSRPLLTIESPKFTDLKHLMVSPIDMSPAMALEDQSDTSRGGRDTTISRLVAALDAL